MEPVRLALLWHQHQPYYPDDVSGETLMPWVRLHGARDYYGMALHLQEVPEFRCTINLVPSLLVQIQACVDGRTDRHLEMSRRPADGRGEDEALYLLNNFVLANVETMIRRWPRYSQLHRLRDADRLTPQQALRDFSTTDLRDLQIWHNLVWIHELAFERDSELQSFRARGAGWTEGDKQWLLDRQLQILGQVIPLHRQLAESGQIELTTTPFYHPILPLLHDRTSARQAMPDCALPRHVEGWPEDAATHVERAVAFHQQVFGHAPRGMWPAEGSVSQAILPAIARAGIEWIASDEEILTQSTSGKVARDAHGQLHHPELLYRPWLVGDDKHQLQMVFRDHQLSDLIGFHYQRSDPHQAADDLLARVETIGRQVSAAQPGRPALVPVILDGENCWEYYPDGGVSFLRTLYRRAATSKNVRPVSIGEHVRQHPATDRIDSLFAGSWISHNFAIWIGHAEDNTAWDLLYETRTFLQHAVREGTYDRQQLARAAEEVAIAQGSDWFWWFGDDHNSDQDDLFDELFRRHLQNVYRLLNHPVPPRLLQPISRASRPPLASPPGGFLPVRVDGRASWLEWSAAGHYVCGNERGTMTLVADSLIRDVYFGFDIDQLFVRIDTAGHAATDLAQVHELHLHLADPFETTLRFHGFTGQPGPLQLAPVVYDDQELSGPLTGVQAAIDRIVELAVPFRLLHARPGTSFGLSLEVVSSQHSIDRAPRESHLMLTVPDEQFEQRLWQV